MASVEFTIILTSSADELRTKENASIDEQERITGIAYEYFLKKAEAIDNKSMRGIFEKSKKSLIIDISKSHSLRTIEKNLSSNNSEEIIVDNFSQLF